MIRLLAWEVAVIFDFHSIIVHFKFSMNEISSLEHELFSSDWKVQGIVIGKSSYWNESSCSRHEISFIENLKWMIVEWKSKITATSHASSLISP